MPSQYLYSYLDKKDKHGAKVSDWAEQSDKGYALCKICVPSCRIGFSKGLGDLNRHSESQKHRTAVENVQSKSQKSMLDFIPSSGTAVQEQARNFEISLVSLMSRHGVPPLIFDCLTETIKTHITDSEIVKNMKLHREKARQITVGGLGEHFQQETIKKMKNADAFSIGIDESVVNKRSELEITVKLASHPGGIENRHYKCVDLEDGTAGTITRTVIEEFEKDNIDFKSKLINVETDGCSTMVGSGTGVKKRFSEEVSQFQPVGSCGAHNISNVMKHATKSFDKDIIQLLVNIYYDLGGAPGKGLTKKHAFEKICEEEGIVPMEFRRYVDTRFRSLIQCIPPVIHNYQGIVSYYKSVPEKKLTDRQKLLKKMFVSCQDITKLKLLFILSGTAELIKSVSFFEKSEADLHNVQGHIEQVVVTQYRRVFDEKEICDLDEKDELVLKSKKDLAVLDLIKTDTLNEKTIFVGNDVEKEIRKLGLRPTSPQLSWFYKKVRNFHLTACEYLQKYFKSTLTSSVLESAAALNPLKQSHVLTSRRLKYLVDNYPLVVENIQKVGGIDQIKKEIDEYVTDLEIKKIDHTQGFEHSWLEVGKLLTGSWPKYEILGRFALALGTMYSATSDVERQFSKMNLIHQSAQRNSMSQETLNAHLNIKSGIENCKDSCSRCEKEISSDHCHCKLFIINKSIREKCRISYQVVRAAASSKKVSEEEKKKLEIRKEQSLEKEKERLEKLTTNFKNGKEVWSKEILMPVYVDVSKSKKSSVDDTKQDKAVDVNENKKRKNTTSNVPVPIKKSKNKPK